MNTDLVQKAWCLESDQSKLKPQLCQQLALQSVGAIYTFPLNQSFSRMIVSIMKSDVC